MIICPFSNFTRPANTTDYADGDLVANSTTAADVVPLHFNVSRLGGGGSIKAVRFYKSTTTTTNADFVLRLFTQDPGISIADNAALSFGDYRYFLGSVDMDISSGGTAGSASIWERYVLTNPIQYDVIAMANKDKVLYGFIEADAAYSPASGELFEVTLEIADD